MTQVTLKIPAEDGTKNIKHEIEKIKLFQFMTTITIVKDILKEVSEDETLKGLFFSDKDEVPTDLSPEQIEEHVKNLDKQFIEKAIGSFQTLAVSLPEKAVELLSCLSGVEEDVLKQQELFDVFEIFDAVVEVNDIDALIGRIKKSLGATVGKLKFLQKRKEATA